MLKSWHDIEDVDQPTASLYNSLQLHIQVVLGLQSAIGNVLLCWMCAMMQHFDMIDLAAFAGKQPCRAKSTKPGWL